MSQADGRSLTTEELMTGLKAALLRHRRMIGYHYFVHLDHAMDAIAKAYRLGVIDGNNCGRKNFGDPE